MVRRELKRAGMRPRSYRVGRLEQHQPVFTLSAEQIELDDLGSVPQRDIGMLTVRVGRQSDGICARHSVALREIETLHDLSVGRIDEEYVIGEIAGDEKLLEPRPRPPRLWRQETG